MSDQPYPMVCARADDVPLVPVGSSFNLKCEECRARLVISPSGMRRLKEHPLTRLICLRCLPRRLKPGVPVPMQLAAPAEEILAELRTAQPNFWRTRN